MGLQSLAVQYWNSPLGGRFGRPHWGERHTDAWQKALGGGSDCTGVWCPDCWHTAGRHTHSRYPTQRRGSTEHHGASEEDSTKTPPESPQLSAPTSCFHHLTRSMNWTNSADNFARLSRGPAVSKLLWRRRVHVVRSPHLVHRLQIKVSTQPAQPSLNTTKLWGVRRFLKPSANNPFSGELQTSLVVIAFIWQIYANSFVTPQSLCLANIRFDYDRGWSQRSLPASEVQPGRERWSCGPRGQWCLPLGNEPLWRVQPAKWTASESCQSHWTGSAQEEDVSLQNKRQMADLHKKTSNAKCS